jgi:SPP1 gp7 family putative phage head morphogenesis protein
LIKDLARDSYRKIATKVLAAVDDGRLWRDLAPEIEEVLGPGAKKRAALIARDQVGKLYGQVQAERHVEIGVRRFIWRTVEDRRVRQSHRNWNGREFSYDDPPRGKDGRKVMPGEEILCRCNGEPVFDDIAADVEARAPKRKRR